MEKEKIGEDSPLRVFIDQNGKFYAAPAALHPSDAENTFATPEMIYVLSQENKPVYREEMNQKVNALNDKKLEAGNA